MPNPLSADKRTRFCFLYEAGMSGRAAARQLLISELEPGTVVVLDNLATHKNKEAAQALRQAGCWFLYLPPYSPDPCVTKNCPPDCFLNAPHQLNWRSQN